jgi:hypothetical protein
MKFPLALFADGLELAPFGKGNKEADTLLIAPLLVGSNETFITHWKVPFHNRRDHIWMFCTNPKVTQQDIYCCLCSCAGN